ncbi:MAG: glycosyltransferase family 4 protein, partial [Planctomycetota bacterium]
MQGVVGKDKINLALFCPKYGKVTFVDELILGLDKERFNVIFIYLSGYGIEENLIEEEGYKVFYLSNIELINAFRFSILFKLIRILKDHKIDILHCHRHKPSFYGAL